VNAQSYQQFGA